MTFGCLVGHGFLNVSPLWLSARWRMTSPRSSGILRRRRRSATDPVTDRSVGSELTGWSLTTRHVNSRLYESPLGGISGCDGWSATHRETLQQEAVIAVMASDMQNSPDCLPGSPLPAQEQLVMSTHPSCTHGGFHTSKWLMGRPARSDSCHFRFVLQEIDFHCWFSASVSLQMTHLNLAGIAWGLRSPGHGLKPVNRFLSFFFT